LKPYSIILKQILQFYFLIFLIQPNSCPGTARQILDKGIKIDYENLTVKRNETRSHEGWGPEGPAFVAFSFGGF
jgi:hypothetical protein